MAATTSQQHTDAVKSAHPRAGTWITNAAEKRSASDEGRTDGDKTRMTADKIFAITELLEKILLHYAHESNPYPQHAPALELFVIQRVSRRFQNVIAGSWALRSLMFLADMDKTKVFAPLRCHSPVRWLFDTKFERSLTGCARDRESKGFKAGLQARTLGRRTWDCFGEAWYRPEASWRGIPICNAREEGVSCLEIRVEVDCNDVEDQAWQFGGRDGLGVVFDKCVEVVEFLKAQDRLVEEQRQRKRCVRHSDPGEFYQA